MCGFWSEKREDVLGITVLVLLFVGLFLLVMFLFGFLWFDVDILAPLAT
jgi:preprotein translocase subunit SecE